MAVDDYFETEVGVAIAATAAVMSPRVRHVLRRGLVYGVAGAMAAGEAITTAGRRVGTVSSDGAAPQSEQAKPAARRARKSAASGA
jgi:hypothetical protein